jgi:hypothetical protein
MMLGKMEAQFNTIVAVLRLYKAKVCP